MSTKLHVGNIPTTVVEDDLRSTFSQLGSVEAVEIARNATTCASKGFAIVAMSRDQGAGAAIGRLNFTQYTGRIIDVSRVRASKP